MYYCRLYWSHIKCVRDQEEQNRIPLRAKSFIALLQFFSLAIFQPSTHPTFHDLAVISATGTFSLGISASNSRVFCNKRCTASGRALRNKSPAAKPVRSA